MLPFWVSLHCYLTSWFWSHVCVHLGYVLLSLWIYLKEQMGLARTKNEHQCLGALLQVPNWEETKKRKRHLGDFNEIHQSNREKNLLQKQE